MKAWDLVRAHPRATVAVVGVATALCLGSYAVGRWASPSKVEVRTERVDVATSFASWDWKASSLWTQTAGPVHRTTTRRIAPGRPEQPPVPGPGGVLVCPECPEVEEEEIVEDIGPVVTTQEGTVESAGQAATEERHEERTERVTTWDAPRWTVGATVGTGWTGGAPQPVSWGGLVGYRVAGPFGVQIQAEGSPSGFSGRAGVTLSF